MNVHGAVLNHVVSRSVYVLVLCCNKLQQVLNLSSEAPHQVILIYANQLVIKNLNFEKMWMSGKFEILSGNVGGAIQGIKVSVVQWLSHSPCKPGVAGSIPGFSKSNNKTSTSWLSLRMLPVQQTHKTTYYTVLVSPRKKKSGFTFVIF